MQDTREYRIAAKVIDRLRKVLDLEVPEAEIGYIAMHLKGAKLRERIGWELEEDNFLLAARTRRLIDYVSERTRVDLHRDSSLFRGLITHLQPAIYRIQKELHIDNPLLADIKRDYGDLFELIRAGVKRTFPEISISGGGNRVSRVAFCLQPGAAERAEGYSGVDPLCERDRHVEDVGGEGQKGASRSPAVASCVGL